MASISARGRDGVREPVPLQIPGPTARHAERDGTHALGARFQTRFSPGLVRGTTLGKVRTVCCSLFSRLGVVAALVCAALFDSRAALGASFVWSAPQACPTDAEVRARVESGLGVGLAELPDIAFEASARQVDQAFELKLKARSAHIRNPGTIRLLAGSGLWLGRRGAFV
jgi:hypothetical protein